MNNLSPTSSLLNDTGAIEIREALPRPSLASPAAATNPSRHWGWLLFMHTVRGCAELCFIMENKRRFEDAHQLMQNWEEGFYQEGREKTEILVVFEEP